MPTKSEVISKALEMLDEKLHYLTIELLALNQSKGEDTKSSAGDKFETGREMISQEISKIESQLSQNRQQKNALIQIQDKKVGASLICSGSLVHLAERWFLISVSLGEINIKQEKVFLLSEGSPLGKSLLGKKEQDQVFFQGKAHTIQKVLN